ncbi:MAG: hypothetical protein SVM80_05770 [Halobacteriota archaeon]|nr:hypothetical protein [Halobacteriota archaeon]
MERTLLVAIYVGLSVVVYFIYLIRLRYNRRKKIKNKKELKPLL